MKRRAFLVGVATTAAGLLLPYEPKRIYSFPSRPPFDGKVAHAALWNRVLTREEIKAFYERTLDAMDLHGLVMEAFGPRVGFGVHV